MRSMGIIMMKWQSIFDFPDCSGKQPSLPCSSAASALCTACSQHRHRTNRRIGLRKSSGANRQIILLEVLIESTTISVIGGSIGILVGILAAYGIGDVVARAMPGGGDWGAVVQPTAIAISFAFAVIVGMGFGLFPAMKASKLEPAEALRYQ